MSTLTQAAGTPLYRRQTPTLLQVVGSSPAGSGSSSPW